MSRALIAALPALPALSMICSLACGTCARAQAAPVEIISHHVEKYENTDCVATNSCSLKRATLDLQNYRVDFSDGPSFGTKAHIAYETSGVASLTDYVVVQFIRGCQFESTLENGEVRIDYSISREFFGETVPFIHTNWVIDSVDTDPVYNSAPGYPRHYSYRWNSVPGSFEKDTQHYFGRTPPARPDLYVRDMPGTAFAVKTGRGISAKNISLEFRSCIYRTSDIPDQSTPADPLSHAQPLVCFEWASSFVYDFTRGEFLSPARISPVCGATSPAPR